MAQEYKLSAQEYKLSKTNQPTIKSANLFPKFTRIKLSAQEYKISKSFYLLLAQEYKTHQVTTTCKKFLGFIKPSRQTSNQPTYFTPWCLTLSKTNLPNNLKPLEQEYKLYLTSEPGRYLAKNLLLVVAMKKFSCHIKSLPNLSKVYILVQVVFGCLISWFPKV